MQGYTLKDKIILSIFSFLGFFVFLKRNPLISDVILKNKNCLFYCRKWSDDALVVGFYEKELIEYLHNYEDNGIFIDIGAHIGKYSILMAKNGMKVIAFEPDLGSFKILKKNIALNNLNNIKALNLACWDSEKEMKLFKLINKNTAGSTLLKPFSGYISNSFSIVKTTRLDNVVRKLKLLHKDIKSIKIDVEGAEIKVLEGATEILKNSHPQIVFEAWDNEKLKQITNFLAKYNYEIKQIDKSNYVAM